MPTELPEPVAAYFAATNAHDVDAMLAHFAATAVVKDEGRVMRGPAAIRKWMEQTIEKYRFTVAALSGTFPGSPIDLRYDISLAGGKISRLDIHP